MRPRSVVALIESRDKRRDHLFETTRQMTVGKLKRIAELDHRFEQLRIETEALEDLGDLLPLGIRGQPSLVDLVYHACRLFRLDPLNPWRQGTILQGTILQGTLRDKPLDWDRRVATLHHSVSQT